jgi:dipeptidase D
LGADNGVGVAMIMAALESGGLSHPPLEAVITTLEETTMGGAAGFDASRLKGKRFINLDWEKEGELVVSCASASLVTIAVPVEYEAVPEGSAAYTLAIGGLTGGHSGIDINKGRANANVIMGHLLNRLAGLHGARIVRVAGGNKDNAIPRECGAVLLFPADRADAAALAVKEAERDFTAVYPGENGLRVTWEKADVPPNAMKTDSSWKGIAALLLAPNGVQSMSPHIAGLVQTSSSLGIVATEKDKVVLTILMRSSVAREQALLEEKMCLLADVIGAGIRVDGQAPPWAYKPDSPLRDKLAEVYKEVYGKEPEIVAVHAGLECAIFSPAMPDADFISIGPTILDVHCPDERMDIPSFGRICGFLVKAVEKL